MADSRYGDRDRGSYGRSDSIFSDDDRGRGRERSSYGEGSRSGNEGGFFQTVQRAGEEVRSWFSDDDDRDRSRGGGMNRSDYGDYESRSRGRSGYGSGRQDYDRGYGSGGRESGGVQSWGQANDARDYDRDERWGGGSDWQSGQRGGQSSYGQADYGRSSYDQSDQSGYGQQGQGGGTGGYRGASSPFDDHYRSWRDQHISQLDREYDDYCRHRQQEFESDFGNWRQNRQGQDQGGSGGVTSSQSGTATGRTGSGRMSEGSGSTTAQSGGQSDRTTASGGSNAQGGSETSATESSAGSSSTSGSGPRTGSRKSQDTK